MRTLIFGKSKFSPGFPWFKLSSFLVRDLFVCTTGKLNTARSRFPFKMFTTISLVGVLCLVCCATVIGSQLVAEAKVTRLAYLEYNLCATFSVQLRWFNLLSVTDISPCPINGPERDQCISASIQDIFPKLHVRVSCVSAEDVSHWNKAVLLWILSCMVQN